MHSSSLLLWTAEGSLLTNMSDILLAIDGRNNLKLLEPKKEKGLAQRSQKWVEETSFETQSVPKNSWNLGLACLSPSHLFNTFTLPPQTIFLYSQSAFVSTLPASSLDLNPQERMTDHPAFPSPTSQCSDSPAQLGSAADTLTGKPWLWVL